MNKALKQLVFGLLIFFLPGCFYFISPLRKAKIALKKGDCEKAQKHFALAEANLAEAKHLKLAEKSALVCRRKGALKEALWFYQYLLRFTEQENRKLVFKEKLAELYFEEIKNYEKALENYFSLREKTKSIDKKKFYSFRIALSYFEIGKWEMSLKALDIFLEEEIKVLFLRARIFLMQEKQALAEREFRKIQTKAPRFFKKNKLFLYLSFIYEHKQEFHKAILELKEFKSSSQFLEDKIKRLKIKKGNQPGVAFGKIL